MENFLKTYLFDDAIGKIVAVILVVAVVWSIIKIVKRRLIRIIHDNESRYRASKLMDFIGFFLMMLMTTVVYRDKLGGLTVAFGVAGIAFALQEVIASVAGWLGILFGGYYKTGDRVQLGGIKGDVVDIGILRTTVLEIGQWVDSDLYNGRIVRIANSFVFKEPVFNYSADFSFVWDEIKIPIMYGSKYDRARELFQRIAGEVTAEDTDKAQVGWAHMVEKYMIENLPIQPGVTVILNDNWVEFTVRYVVSFRKRRITKNELFTRILAAVEATDGAIKFASATFHLVEAPEIKVLLRKN